MRGIVKSFLGVKALRGVDLELRLGEVLALLGENGAGKSTLMRILGGAHPPESGTISLDGHFFNFQSPQDARRAGVAIIHQEFSLVPSLNAVENIFLGFESSRFGFLQRTTERAKAADLFRRLGVEIDLTVPVRQLTTARQQLVEIARALAFEPRLLVMDEPTAALSTHEVDRLFSTIHDLKKQGIGLIYISHRLDEIFSIADRVCVLRDGQNAGGGAIDEINRAQLISMMVGRALMDEFPSRTTLPGEVRLKVERLRRGEAVREVSFEVRRGEILALTGLMGAGRTETARLLFGADPRDSGMVRLDGRELRLDSPRQAIAEGIGLLTEDRKQQGLVLNHSVRENFGLPNLDRFSRGGFVAKEKEGLELSVHTSRLGIKTAGWEQRVGSLSGGNQQKVVLAKWLARDCEVLIFDEPTRGIDVGSKYEIYTLMNELVAAGKSIVMISSELPEVLGMADRIVVMREGRVTGEIPNARTATQEDVLRLAVA
ncbi:MAG: sugar ABC transporter ATP-binding protein [Pedosphaera sp.]|nr:sugar ABC transporter ATP-binding protein [Pedosphaera sp.]